MIETSNSPEVPESIPSRNGSPGPSRASTTTVTPTPEISEQIKNFENNEISDSSLGYESMKFPSPTQDASNDDKDIENFNKDRIINKSKPKKNTQRFRSAREFLLIFCFVILIFDASSSFMLGSTTSLEKHFHFSSKNISFMVILSQIGPTLTALLISYIAGKGNRPRYMAFGTLIAAVGNFLHFITVFIYPPSILTDIHNLTGSKRYCDHNDIIAYYTSRDKINEDNEEICFASNSASFAIGVIGFTLIAVGNIVVLTVGLPYMDDSIQKKDTPVYLSIILAVRVFGPIVGFSLSSSMDTLYVYPHIEPGMNQSDPRWIGAWWIGPLIFSVLLLIFSILISYFPIKLTRDYSLKIGHTQIQIKTTKPNEIEHDDDSLTISKDLQSPDVISINNNEITKKLKELSIYKGKMETTQPSLIEGMKSTAKRITSNRILVYSVIGDLFTVISIMGLYFWLTKYLEHQFRVDKTTSNLYIGISSTSSIIVGMVGGAIFIRRCRPTAKTLAIIIIVCKLIYSISLVSMMTISCDFNDDQPGLLSADGNSLDIYMSCSAGCRCSQREFVPTCVEDGPIQLTFFSPCHAGCPVQDYKKFDSIEAFPLVDVVTLEKPTERSLNPKPITEAPINLESFRYSTLDESQRLYNCSCGSSYANVRPGYCKTKCSGFTIYIVINVIIQSLIALATLASLLITIRCVAIYDKTMALGAKATAYSFGMMIYPFIFGSLTDSSCLVWEEVCGETGSCWVYNAQHLGYKLHATAAVILILAVIFDIFVAKNVRDLQILDKSIYHSKDQYSSKASSATVSRTTSTTFADDNARSAVSLRSFRRIRPSGSGDVTPEVDETQGKTLNNQNTEGRKKKASSYDSYIASFGRASIRNVKAMVDPSARDTYHLQQHHVFTLNSTSIEKKSKSRPQIKQIPFEQTKEDDHKSPSIVRQSPVDDQAFDTEIFDITQQETETNLSINGFKITGV